MRTGKALESEFYQYMYDSGQADAQWNRYVLEFYTPYFVPCRDVLDIGCGEGQFIELLEARGINVSGIDSDTQMVRNCFDKGLNVVEADLFDYLPQQRGRFDGIFCSNVVEHLSAQEAIRFVQITFEALRPGGVFLVTTPNPGSLIVHLYEFWRDATHVRLYSRFLLEFLLSWAGFCNVQSGENPRTVWTPPAELQAVPKSLEDLSSWKRFSPLSIGTILEPVIRPDSAIPKWPFWRRVAFSLRRRLARFLVQTVLFEEFSAISAALKAISATTQQVGRALYQSQSNLLLAPREIFAKGIKPSAASEDSG